LNNKKLCILIPLMISGCANIPILEQSSKTNIISVQLDKNKGSDWWVELNDEQLNGILEDVLKNNSDLKIMKLSLEKSIISYDLSDIKQYATVDLNSSFEKEKLSGKGMTPPPYAGSIINMGQIGFHGAYAIDYMNKNNLEVEQKNKELLGVNYQIDNVKLAVQGQVVQLYFYYQYLLKTEELIKEKQSIQNEIEKSYIKGINLGKILPSDLLSIESNGIKINNEMESVLKNKELTISSLISLSGNKNISIKQQSKIMLFSEQEPVRNIGINQLKNRPDLKFYLTNIEAQQRKISSLKADFYPSITMTGDIGLQKVGFANMFNRNAQFWNIGPSISLPIFDSGRIADNYKFAGVELKEFIEKYNQKVFLSVKEVNDAIYSEKSSYQILKNQIAITDNVEKINKSNLNLFKNGKQTKIFTLNAKMQLVNEQQSLLSSRLNYIDAKIDRIQSVGGNNGK